MRYGADVAGDLINHIIRAVLLVGLLGYFGWSLGRGLVEDDRRLGFRRLETGSAGQDPGVRVLLENRQPPDPIRAWDKLDIAILATVDVVTPNIPDDPAYRLTLHAGSTLRVQPDANTGLVLGAKEWGKDYTWPVSAVRIQPTLTDPEAPPLATGGALPGSKRDPTLFEASDHEAVFALPGGRYRGSLEVLWHSAKDVEAINCLPMESYVEGVIAVEMSPSFPLQALKAQAIASRSYAYAHGWLARHANQEYDLADTGDDQEYRGTGSSNDAVRMAMSDTRGFIMLADHTDPFAPMFCASSGGYTESIDGVLPGARDVYGRVPLNQIMTSQPDAFCKFGIEGLGYLNSHWTNVAVIKPSELQLKLSKLLQVEGRQVGFIKSLRVGQVDKKSGRVETVLIFHTGTGPNAAPDPLEMSTHSFRMLVGPSLLRSTLWTSDSPRRRDSTDGKRTVTWEITSTGYGHGVGMSQVSAWEMATEGYSASEILRTFYHGVDFQRKW
jgi:peptidoglycan hydrolase-like amidase